MQSTFTWTLSRLPRSRKMDSISVGQELSGTVKNCTHFGAFVDIGVGKDGLIHISQMDGRNVNTGDRVTVRVVSLDHTRERIGLMLLY